MTDSKVPDAQAGYEKGISVAMAALQDAIMSESAGMMASLAGSFRLNRWLSITIC